MAEPIEIDVPSGGKLIDPVRELARDGKLPLYWRCGQGTCGACLVRLEHDESVQALPIALTGKERNVLARAGKLGEDQRAALTLPDTPDLPRLACHVVLAPGALTVRWD
jgi:ferredoxin